MSASTVNLNIMIIESDRFIYSERLSETSPESKEKTKEYSFPTSTNFVNHFIVLSE